eukprot:5682262-Prymnesium_polylepis.1
MGACTILAAGAGRLESLCAAGALNRYSIVDCVIVWTDPSNAQQLPSLVHGVPAERTGTP